MGKKKKDHRARVARRNQIISRIEDMMTVKIAILQGVKARGFSSVDEALEKAPWIFSELFPGKTPEQISNILKF